MLSYITDHYIFNYKSGTLAEEDIKSIARKQEESFNKICNVLKVDFKEKINYFLFDSPLEVGMIYGTNEPINGFARWGENKIYAVYNDTIKCIGPHEDAHLISFLINAPESDFIVEGLAMFFDEKWWNLDNDIWTSYYKYKDKKLSISKLLSNKEFEKHNCEITYPVAGSFTKYLITNFGIDKYIELYKIINEPNNNDFIKIFNQTIEKLEFDFWNKINKVKYDFETVKSKLENN